MKRIRLLALVFAVAIGSTTAVALAAKSQSPKTLLASILRVARAQHSVHWVQTVKHAGSLLTYATDAGANEGTQELELSDGTSTAILTIRLIHRTEFVQGNAAGLYALQGLTRMEAETYSERWISVPKGDSDYGAAAVGLTLSSVVASITPHGRLATVSGKLHGASVVGVRGASTKGKKTSVSVLYAPAHGKRLPLEVRTPAHKGSNTTVLSKWNESVNVTAPAKSVPIATVRGG